MFLLVLDAYKHLLHFHFAVFNNSLFHLQTAQYQVFQKYWDHESKSRWPDYSHTRYQGPLNYVIVWHILGIWAITGLYTLYN